MLPAGQVINGADRTEVKTDRNGSPTGMRETPLGDPARKNLRGSTPEARSGKPAVLAEAAFVHSSHGATRWSIGVKGVVCSAR